MKIFPRQFGLLHNYSNVFPTYIPFKNSQDMSFKNRWVLIKQKHILKVSAKAMKPK